MSVVYLISRFSSDSFTMSRSVRKRTIASVTSRLPVSCRVCGGELVEIRAKACIRGATHLGDMLREE